jgi:DNA-binding response OmpR family regulator
MSDNTKQKILIVEDDLDIANVYNLKFEKEGFDVYVAADGEDGLNKALNWQPDLILLDIMLPKKDGFSVLAAIKQNEQTKNIPVIMWTNLSNTEEARKAKELGATDYLVKVFNMPAEIVAKAKEQLLE